MSDPHRPAPVARSLAAAGLILTASVAVVVSGSVFPAGAAEPGAAETGSAGGPACCAAAVAADARPSSEWTDAKSRRLAEIFEASAASPHAYLGTERGEDLRRRAEEARGGDEIGAFGAAWAYGRYQLQAGEIDAAVRTLEAAVADLEASGRATPQLIANAWFGLGMAHFRRAERRNCIAHHNAESCIFPLAGDAVHVDPEPARRALEIFERLLDAGDHDRTEECVWMINIAHQALGTWPDSVPEELRLSAEHFGSDSSMGRFDDVAGALGLDRFGRAGGVLLEDFTGDGRLDVMTSAFDPGKSLRLFRNEPDGTFRDVTEAAGLSGQLGGIHLVRGDYDNDGRLDVLVLRGGGLGAAGEMPNSLLRQTEPGRFEDVTAAAGIEVAAPTRTAAFGDVDRDGDLDLFVGYESEVRDDGSVAYPHRLWINRGDGTFRDDAAAAGISATAACAGAAFGDYDRDGNLDLFLSLRESANVLYRNRGDGTFEDVTDAAGVAMPRASSAAGFLDTNNDGLLDLFVAHENPYHTAAKEVLAFYRDGTVPPETCRLYRGLGDGTFRDVTEAQGLARAASGPSVAFGDADGDGFPDLYLGTGDAEMSSLWPNLLLRNRNGGKFVDVTQTAGVGHLQKAGGLAFGDLDDDGDQDLFVQVGGYYLDDGFGDVLFRNPRTPANWVRVELEGVQSNRFGVGAQVSFRVRERKRERFIRRNVGIGSSSGGNSLRIEAGLGRADRLQWILVEWPSGEVNKVFQPPSRCTVRIREGRESLEVVRSDAVPFATGAP